MNMQRGLQINVHIYDTSVVLFEDFMILSVHIKINAL